MGMEGLTEPPTLKMCDLSEIPVLHLSKLRKTGFAAFTFTSRPCSRPGAHTFIFADNVHACQGMSPDA